VVKVFAPFRLFHLPVAPFGFFAPLPFIPPTLRNTGLGFVFRFWVKVLGLGIRVSDLATKTMH